MKINKHVHRRMKISNIFVKLEIALEQTFEPKSTMPLKLKSKFELHYREFEKRFFNFISDTATFLSGK